MQLQIKLYYYIIVINNKQLLIQGKQQIQVVKTAKNMESAFETVFQTYIRA